MKRFIAGLVLVAIFGVAWMSPTGASSHREAPLTVADPLADNTDVYAFVSPERTDKVVLISNFVPFQFPSGGPNFYPFDPNVLYEIMVDNSGDAVEDVTFQFRFRTEIRNPNTFLYNTGPVTSLGDPDLNVRQFMSVTRVLGRRRGGTATTIATDVPVHPSHVGSISMPDYHIQLQDDNFEEAQNIRMFAGQREEGFYIDVGATFDLLQLRTLNNVGPPIDGLAGFNVNSIALEVPITMLTRSGTRPTTLTDPNATIGVWSTASRGAVTSRSGSGQTESGEFVQISRLGNPLVNEVVIPLSTKDAFNRLEPTGDGAALSFVTEPILAPLLTALFRVQTPPTPRNDLVTIFLTGIPGLNQIGTSPRPSEMLRLNTAVPPTSRPHRLGVLAGDNAGFPNGRRVGDDVVDIALRAMAGGTPLTPEFNRAPNNTLGDGVDGNDKEYRPIFPFLTDPHSGRELGPAPRIMRTGEVRRVN